MKIKKLLFNNIYFILVFIVVVITSYISRPPIYGKLKFILLNTFYPSYDYARLFSEKSLSINKNTFIKSDPITEYTLYSLLVNPTESKDRIFETFPYLRISISEINPLYYSANSACLINLKGFPDTWVPHLTGHWDPIISNTSRFYEHNGYRGKKNAITIENEFKNKCIVLKDQEIPWEEGENFRYLSPNLNYTNQQQDVHILQFWSERGRNKYNILIDVGWVDQTKEKLLDYLAINEIYHIDEIFISHPHKDHYSGLYELINFGIPIKKIWMNLPLKEYCNMEIPWGCDYPDLKKLIELIKQKGIEHREIYNTDPNLPKILFQDSNSKLELLFASPPVNPQAGNRDINDLSMIIELQTNGTSYLFTGDLNSNLSNFLKNYSIFETDILKVPHHGTEGVASDDFFDTVKAKVGIVPSPKDLWCSDRSSRIFKYFKRNNRKLYVSGFHGDISIRHFSNGKYKVSTEFDPDEVCGIKQSWWKF